jgi:hypothetical protein
MALTDKTKKCKVCQKEFPELRYEVNNGITLCQHHHPRKKEDVAKLSPYFQNLVASLD